MKWNWICLGLFLGLIFVVPAKMYGDCPESLKLFMGGTQLSMGDPVCRGAVLDITIFLESPIGGGGNKEFALFWDTDGSHTGKNQVYNSPTSVLFQDTINVPLGLDSVNANPWIVNPYSGINTFYIYAVRAPGSGGCSGEVAVFQVRLAEMTAHPADTSECEGENIFFAATPSYFNTGNSFPRWLVDQGSGFDTISIYTSNPTIFTTTLLWGPLLASMNGEAYKLSLRYGNSISDYYCEIFSDSAVLTVGSPPDASLTVSPTAVVFCKPWESSTITIQNTESGVTYVLRDPNNNAVDCGIGNGSNLDLNLSAGTGSGTYTIEAGTGSCGSNPSLACATTLTTTLFVQDHHTFINSIGDDETICEGQPIPTLDGTYSESAGGMSGYLWQSSTSGPGGPFGPATGINTDSIYDSPSIGQTTWYQLIKSSDFGGGLVCYDTSNVVEFTLNAVDAGMIEDDQSICQGDTPADLDSSPGGNGSGSGTIRYQYNSSFDGSSWMPIGMTYTTSTQYAFSTSPTQTTFYNRVTRSVLNGINCYDTSNVITITVNELPTINIDPEGPFCSNDPAISLSVTVSPSNGSGSWSGTGITNASLGTFDPAFANIGNNTIQYSHTLNTGCSDVETSNIVVNQAPILVDTTVMVCIGDLVNYGLLATDISGAPGPAFSYYITLNDAQTGSSPISSVETFNTIGTYVRFYRRVTNGCVDIATITVNVTGPDVNLNISPGSFDFCSMGVQGTITIQNAENGLTYVLRNQGGIAVACGIGTGSNLDLTFSPNGSGVYFVEVGIGSCGPNPNLSCNDTLISGIVVNERNVSAGNIGLDATICAGSSIALSSPSSNPDGGTPSFFWEQSIVGAGGPWLPAVGNNTSPTYIASPSITTWYRLVYNSNFGAGVSCSDSSNVVEITVNNVDAGTIEEDQTICEGDSPNNLDSSPGGDGFGSGTIRYQYVLSTDGTTWVSAGGNYGTNTAYTFPINPTVTTFYARVTRSALNGLNCYDTSNVVTITVNELPSINLGPVFDVCSNDPPFNIPVSVSPSNGSGTWSGPAITDPVNGTFDPSIAPIGSNTVSYTHTLNTGCSDSENLSLIANQSPELRDTTTSACVGDPIDYIPLSNDVSGLNGPAFEYYSTVNDAQTGTSPISSSETFNMAGNFQRFYRRLSNGCLDIALIDITVLPPPAASSISLSVDPPRICLGDTTNLQICGLEPNVTYSITYDTNGSPPRTENINTDGNGCYSLPTNAFNTIGTKTYEIESINFSSGCGISPNPIPANLSIDVEVNGRPDANDVIDSLESLFCYNGSPGYALSGLDANTSYTIQYTVNGGIAQSFSGATDGAGFLYPSLARFTEDISIELQDLRYNDGDTECAANPAPNNSSSASVLPDLSLINLIGDTICEDPTAQSSVTFQNVPTIGQEIDFVLSTSEGDIMGEIPINAGPEFVFTFPFGVDIIGSQVFQTDIRAISFRNSPQCLDDTTRNDDVIQVNERPFPDFDNSGESCYSEERTILNLTTPEAARPNYAYLWIYNGSVLSTGQDLVYTFPERESMLSLTLIAGSGDCIDSISKTLSFITQGPDRPEIAVIRKEGDANSAVLVADVPGYNEQGLAGLQFQWYESGNLIAGETKRYLYVSNYTSGTLSYQVSAMDPNLSDCEIFSEPRRISGDGTIPSRLDLFPNPNNGSFNLYVIQEMEGMGVLQIWDLQGRVIYQQSFDKQEAELRLKLALPISAGSYIARWKLADGEPLYQRFLVH